MAIRKNKELSPEFFHEAEDTRFVYVIENFLKIKITTSNCIIHHIIQFSIKHIRIKIKNRTRITHTGIIAHKNPKRIHRNGNESKSNLRVVPVRHPAVCHRWVKRFVIALHGFARRKRRRRLFYLFLN